MNAIKVQKDIIQSGLVELFDDKIVLVDIFTSIKQVFPEEIDWVEGNNDGHWRTGEYLVFYLKNFESAIYRVGEEIECVAKFPFSIDAYSAGNRFFIGRKINENSEIEAFYKINADGFSVTELKELSLLKFPFLTGTFAFGQFVFLQKDRMTEKAPFHIVVYDDKNEQVIAELSEELNPYTVTYKHIFLLHLTNHTLIAGWNGDYFGGYPPRLLSIDLHTKAVKDLVLFDDFIEQPIAFPHEGCSSQIPEVTVNSFSYDPVSNCLVCLFKTGVYWFDLTTMSGRYELFPDEFLPNYLLAATGGHLFGDHIYFVSTVRGAFVPDVKQSSLGAFNIRTGKLDWHYHFPVDYVTNSLHPPKANEYYIVAKDAEQRLHIFEKQKPS
ncbi:MAG: hypothetical protein R2795_02810 [Saprospiraceae bacterium]